MAARIYSSYILIPYTYITFHLSPMRTTFLLRILVEKSWNFGIILLVHILHSRWDGYVQTRNLSKGWPHQLLSISLYRVYWMEDFFYSERLDHIDIDHTMNCIRPFPQGNPGNIHKDNPKNERLYIILLFSSQTSEAIQDFNDQRLSITLFVTS